jgi:diguanylate cyclase (GGDEF)-like protein
MNRRFQVLALTDLLTELRNRRYAMERLQQEWSACQRTGKTLSVIMIDIDFFKRVNDTYGHDAGDKMLKETARLLRNEVRVGDDAIRLGGEEFLVMCYDTRADDAAVCAERVRAAAEANVLTYGGHEISVTLSLGIAEVTPEMVGVDDLLRAADRAVYEAKHAGRNRVCIHRPSTPLRETA